MGAGRGKPADTEVAAVEGDRDLAAGLVGDPVDAAPVGPDTLRERPAELERCARAEDEELELTEARFPVRAVTSSAAPGVVSMSTSLNGMLCPCRKRLATRQSGQKRDE